MMSYCQKSVHSFLGLNNISTEHSCKCMAVSSSLPGGLGLIHATEDTHKTPNVVESACVKSSSPLSLPPLATRKDPGGIGFIDDIGGGVGGLMSCTESLGFESSDERTADDEIELCSSTKTTTRVKWRKGGEKREIKRFPPPISTLNHNGRPSFLLRPVRRDGRLELREIRIDRPEVLHTSRQGGRLRLHFVREVQDIDIREEEKENDQEKEEEQYDVDQLQKEQEQEEENQEVEGKIEEVEEADNGIGQWRLPVNGESLRRCHDHHHHPRHHHDLHAWGQHCVMTS